MTTGKEIIKEICVLSYVANTDIQKTVNLIKQGESLYYQFGIWSGNPKKCIDEFLLSEKEMKELLREAKKQSLQETELERFQKDYIQQIHNGSVQLRKEKLLK